MRKLLLIFTALATVLTMSCSKQLSEVLTSFPDVTKELESCYVSQDRLALFADLSPYNLTKDNTYDTKSSDQEVYPLSSLLDFDLSKEKTFNGKLFKQIPFKQNRDGLLASIHKSSEISIDSCAFIRKYLIEAVDESNKWTYVVTLVPETESDMEYDFLNKANFSGLCIFSQLDGSGVYCQRYIAGQIFKSTFVNASDLEDETEYLSLVEMISTKEGDNSTYAIYGSICVDHKPWISPSYCIDNYLRRDDGSNNSNGNNYGSSGPGSQPSQDNAISDSEKLYPQEDECFIEAISNVGKDREFSCNAKCYAKGSTIIVTPKIQVDGEDQNEHTFSYWLGDFSYQTYETFYTTVERDMRSIAYYDVQKPCVDSETGKANPLSNMSIAASSSWNYKGGTFGYTRNGGTKRHDGIDFAADPGTPVFSMFDGVVTRIDNSHTDHYEYASYGNVIEIKSTFNGQTVILMYAHLLYGRPIAGDPFTGETLTVGSHVYQGQLIGYTGKTGNAFDVPNKHLHLGYKSKEGTEWKDPAPLINGDIDAEHQNSTKKGKIDKIKCN